MKLIEADKVLRLEHLHFMILKNELVGEIFCKLVLETLSQFTAAQI